MARKTKTVTISSEDSANRDGGKNYLITEMPSSKAEKWAARALLALIASGMEIPDDVAGSGIAGLASVSPNLFSDGCSLSWEALEPLLDEMMACIQVIVGKTGLPVTRPVMTDDDIEEVSTRILLRKEIIELHLGFSLAAAQSKQGQAAMPAELPTGS